MMTRDEATAACRNVRNLWPRDESEALRYRRAMRVLGGDIPRAPLGVKKTVQTHSGIVWDIEHRESSETSVPRVAECHGVPEGYALVEWLAPDGRCADHGDVERHGEHLVRQADGGAWVCYDESQRVRVGHYHIDTASGIVPVGEYRFPQCTEADRFRGHEGDPWCGKYHLMPGLVRADYHEGDGLRLYKAPRRFDGSILAVPVPRERLTAEHPDHARHREQWFMRRLRHLQRSSVFVHDAADDIEIIQPEGSPPIRTIDHGANDE